MLSIQVSNKDMKVILNLFEITLFWVTFTLYDLLEHNGLVKAQDSGICM